MKTETDIKVFRTIISVVSSLMLLYLAFTGWENQATVFVIYIIFLLGCLGYYIARETVIDKERARAKKAANPPVIYRFEGNVTTVINPQPAKPQPGDHVAGHSLQDFAFKGNRYEYAIEHNETTEFLLGKGKYLFPDYERANTHKPSGTFWHIEQYGKTEGYALLLERLEGDINAALSGDITPFDLLIIKTYIWIYAYKFYEEKAGLAEWVINPATKTLFRRKLEHFIALYGTGGGEFKRDSENNEFYTDQLIKSVALLRGRFGINLME